VDPALVLILLLHPIAALLVIREFILQRDWRKKSLELKGQERASESRRHEIEGERLFRLVIAVIGLAFLARFVSASLSGEDLGYDDLMPGHFHGWGGLLGLLLMTYLWVLGRRASSRKAAGESFSKTKNLHGRLSDVMMVLIIIHAFLGFLYLLQLIGNF
tara:strand:- start:778 stop:1257 length:480 start_codon:yes stop_codon:yes gene_type:complete